VTGKEKKTKNTEYLFIIKNTSLKEYLWLNKTMKITGN
jgi:hypothetical protein